MVWNLSPTGWRVSGNLPLERGDVCSLNLTLPNKQISGAAGIVRWAQGQAYILETLVMDGKAQAHLSDYIRPQTKAL
jgi:hypothetical protein